MSKLNKQLAKYGDWGLVAGAASGLGYAFSKTIAQCGKNVIMVDIDEKALNKSAAQLESQFDVSIDRLVCDLTRPDDVTKMIQSIQTRRCRLVIYNAAYGPVKEFQSFDEEELDKILNLNCRTLLKLAWTFSRHAPSDKKSGFLAMSSMAGLRGTQLVAPYAASKAFTWNLIESLHYEFANSHLDFSALCAGPIATPTYLETRPNQSIWTPKPHSPDFVAKKALRLLGNYAIGIPGISNNFNNFLLARVFPRSWASKIANHVMAAMYRKE